MPGYRGIYSNGRRALHASRSTSAVRGFALRLASDVAGAAAAGVVDYAARRLRRSANRAAQNVTRKALGRFARATSRPARMRFARSARRAVRSAGRGALRHVAGRRTNAYSARNPAQRASRAATWRGVKALGRFAFTRSAFGRQLTRGRGGARSGHPFYGNQYVKLGGASHDRRSASHRRSGLSFGRGRRR
jgi:hypothetical protein